MLFLHFFPGLSKADFDRPEGFPIDQWEIGKQLINSWTKRGN